MLMLQTFLIQFGHKGETHSDVVESGRHIAELSPWFAALGVVLAIFVIPFLLRKSRPKSTLWLFALLAGLLVTGMLSYSVFPVISTLSIFAGFLIALLLTIGGLLR